MPNSTHNGLANRPDPAIGSGAPVKSSRLARLLRGRVTRTSKPSCSPTTHRTEAALQLYAMRRRRAKYFDCDLFGEPAWDILLILYWAEIQQIRLTVSDVCEAAEVPSTTALRWINGLETKNIVIRTPHPSDGRVYRLSLSQDAVDRMAQMMDEVPLEMFGGIPSTMMAA